MNRLRIIIKLFRILIPFKKILPFYEKTNLRQFKDEMQRLEIFA
jgi:hypothetical protein